MIFSVSSLLNVTLRVGRHARVVAHPMALTSTLVGLVDRDQCTTPAPDLAHRMTLNVNAAALTNSVRPLLIERTVTEPGRGTSSSVMFTVDSPLVPKLTPVGSVPKPSSTDSPSSSTLSFGRRKSDALFGVAAVERYTRVGRHTRIVAISCPALVGPADRDLSRSAPELRSG